MIRTEIILMNTYNIEPGEQGITGKEAKSISLNMLVHPEYYQTRINNSIQEMLQLPFIERRTFYTEAGEPREFDVLGPAWIKLNGLIEICHPLLDPNCTDPVLGKIDLINFNLVPDMNTRTLIQDPKNRYSMVRIRYPSKNLS